eukprot:363991_1
MSLNCLSRCLQRIYTLFVDVGRDNWNSNLQEFLKIKQLVTQLRPFNLNIFYIEPMAHGSSNECFMIKTRSNQNKNNEDKNVIKYKLHICKSSTQANQIDTNMKIIQNNHKINIMPYYYGKDCNFLLFKYLNDPLIHHKITSWNETQIINENITICVESLCMKLGYILGFANWKIKFKSNDDKLQKIKTHYSPNIFKQRLESINILNS